MGEPVSVDVPLRFHGSRQTRGEAPVACDVPPSSADEFIECGAHAIRDDFGECRQVVVGALVEDPPRRSLGYLPGRRFVADALGERPRDGLPEQAEPLLDEGLRVQGPGSSHLEERRAAADGGRSDFDRGFASVLDVLSGDPLSAGCPTSLGRTGRDMSTRCRSRAALGEAVMSTGAGTLRDEMAMSGQRLLAACGRSRWPPTRAHAPFIRTGALISPCHRLRRAEAERKRD
jgi:hypothetical protein